MSDDPERHDPIGDLLVRTATGATDGLRLDHPGGEPPVLEARTRRRWLPVSVAAAVVLVLVAGGLIASTAGKGGEDVVTVDPAAGTPAEIVADAVDATLATGFTGTVTPADGAPNGLRFEPPDRVEMTGAGGSVSISIGNRTWTRADDRWNLMSVQIPAYLPTFLRALGASGQVSEGGRPGEYLVDVADAVCLGQDWSARSSPGTGCVVAVTVEDGRLAAVDVPPVGNGTNAFSVTIGPADPTVRVEDPPEETEAPATTTSLPAQDEATDTVITAATTTMATPWSATVQVGDRPVDELRFSPPARFQLDTATGASSLWVGTQRWDRSSATDVWAQGSQSGELPAAFRALNSAIGAARAVPVDGSPGRYRVEVSDEVCLGAEGASIPGPLDCVAIVDVRDGRLERIELVAEAIVGWEPIVATIGPADPSVRVEQPPGETAAPATTTSMAG